MSFLSSFSCDDKKSKKMTNEELSRKLLSDMTGSYCEFIGRCPQPGSWFNGMDKTACQTFMEVLFGDHIMLDFQYALENGASYNSSRMSACQNAMKQLACDEDPDMIPECRQILTGSLATGESCYSDYQCASGWCDQTIACPGVCAETLPKGGTCFQSSQCNAGLFCDYREEVCTDELLLAEPGEECEYSSQCAHGLSCVVTDFQNWEGTCQPWLNLNDECNLDGSWGLTCGPDLVCDDTTGRCTAITVVALGQTCNGETLVCDLGQRAICTGDMEEPGLCKKLPGDQEPCLEGECWPGHYCGVDNLCHIRVGIGAACTDDRHCTSEWCDDGTCNYNLCPQESWDSGAI